MMKHEQKTWASPSKSSARKKDKKKENIIANLFYVACKGKNYPPLTYNDISVLQKTFQKRFWRRLTISIWIIFPSIINKTNNFFVYSSKLEREALTAIYKTFIRPNMDYGDVIFQ